MAKRYLGGGISFEQQDVYQEFSEDDTPTPSGSTTLAGLTDVDISNPANGQTLVYNATSGKWENGSTGGGLVVLQGTPYPDEKPTVQLSVTYAEVYAMMQHGPVVVKYLNLDGIDIGYELITVASLNDGVYSVVALNLSGSGAASDMVLLTLPY